MEVNEIQTQAHKFSSINSTARKIDSTKVVNNNPINNAALWDRLYSNNGVENLCETLATENTSTEVPALGVSLLASRTGSVNNGNEVGNGLLRGWQQSSRIIRVSRASGGKDRHSKVWTAKGARDRRVRLSVTTAIQFYDLQDRLGLDQPSKAVEWLIQAASDAITELPPLDDGSTTSFPPELSTLNGFPSSFPGTPRQQRDDERRSPSDLAAGLATDSSSLDGIGAHRNNQTHNLSSSNLSKSSDYNSPSGTSKGSGDNLSIISRIENGVKLSRDNRSRKRTAKQMDSFVQSSSSPNTTASSSFTQLLTASIGIVSDEKQLRTRVISSTPSPQAASTQQQWCTSSSSTTDYFSHISPMISTSRPSSGFIQLDNSIPQVTDLLHQQYYHPYAVADNPHRVVVPVPVPVVAAAVPTTTGLWAVGSNNNNNNSDIYHDLNFSISSPSPSLSVLNNSRGTLQSNSQLQRFSSSNFTLDADIHHQYQYQQQQQFPAGLQLYFGDTNGSRHSDQKEKGKN